SCASRSRPTPLAVRFPVGRARGPRIPDFGASFSAAPALRGLTTDGIVLAQLLSCAALPWAQLTSFSSSGYTLARCLSVLRRAQLLDHCVLSWESLASSTPSPLSPPSAPLSESPLVRLRSLAFFSASKFYSRRPTSDPVCHPVCRGHGMQDILPQRCCGCGFFVYMNPVDALWIPV
ncbi:hypothetical protein FB451DRAFT_1496635, partial [Mycena latifolia]